MLVSRPVISRSISRLGIEGSSSARRPQFGSPALRYSQNWHPRYLMWPGGGSSIPSWPTGESHWAKGTTAGRIRREITGRESSTHTVWLRRRPRSNPSPENGGKRGGEWGGNSRFSCFRAMDRRRKASDSGPDYAFRFRTWGCVECVKRGFPKVNCGVVKM